MQIVLKHLGAHHGSGTKLTFDRAAILLAVSTFEAKHRINAVDKQSKRNSDSSHHIASPTFR